MAWRIKPELLNDSVAAWQIQANQDQPFSKKYKDTYLLKQIMRILIQTKNSNSRSMVKRVRVLSLSTNRLISQLIEMALK
jgi:hypothetical protein